MLERPRLPIREVEVRFYRDSRELSPPTVFNLLYHSPESKYSVLHGMLKSLNESRPWGAISRLTKVMEAAVPLLEKEWREYVNSLEIYAEVRGYVRADMLKVVPQDREDIVSYGPRMIKLDAGGYATNADLLEPASIFREITTASQSEDKNNVSKKSKLHPVDEMQLVCASLRLENEALLPITYRPRGIMKHNNRQYIIYPSCPRLTELHDSIIRDSVVRYAAITLSLGLVDKTVHHLNDFGMMDGKHLVILNPRNEWYVLKEVPDRVRESDVGRIYNLFNSKMKTKKKIFMESVRASYDILREKYGEVLDEIRESYLLV